MEIARCEEQNDPRRSNDRCMEASSSNQVRMQIQCCLSYLPCFCSRSSVKMWDLAKILGPNFESALSTHEDTNQIGIYIYYIVIVTIMIIWTAWWLVAWTAKCCSRAKLPKHWALKQKPWLCDRIWGRWGGTALNYSGNLSLSNWVLRDSISIQQFSKCSCRIFRIVAAKSCFRVLGDWFWLVWSRVGRTCVC